MKLKRTLVWCGVAAWGLLGFGGASAQGPEPASAPVCVAEDNNSDVLTCDRQLPHLDCVG